MTKENKKPASYMIQACCANCTHAFIMEEYDSGTTYFCHIDRSKRPPCQSVYMKETTQDKYDKDHTLDYDTHGLSKYDIWDEWGDPREVKAWGYCTEHILKEKNDA